MMKIVAVLAVLFLVSAQAFAEEPGDADELSYWSDWSDGEQNKEELPLPFEHFLQRIARRPRPQQFYGLMGKRDSGYGPLSHKRHKTDSFVGLMGKRALSSGPFFRLDNGGVLDLQNGIQHKCMREDVNKKFMPYLLKSVCGQVS